VALVVEDHEDTRCLLKVVLSMHGFEVVEAENGEQAIDLANRRPPRIILMDSTLPRMDGIAATRRLRERETLNRVPIIFLSGRAEPTALADARAAGCSDYLVKPVDMRLLEQVLDRCFAEAKLEGLETP
jgi:CheY-like chemotaxis protein